MALRIAFITMLIAALAANCFASVCQQDFTINGINLNDKYEKIIQVMGKPTKQIEDEGQLSLIHLSYPGLKISVKNKEGKIVYIMADTADYQTHRGVKIGATPYKVMKAYGQPAKAIIKGHIYYIYDTDPQSGDRLVFDMTNGYVSKIILTNMPLED